MNMSGVESVNTPGFYYAIAYGLSCILIILNSRRRFNAVKTILMQIIFFLLLSGIMIVSDGIEALFVPLMLLYMFLIFLNIYLNCTYDRKTVEALDYVLKPINYFAFSQRIERAMARMERRTQKFVSVNYKGSVKKIRISDIYYIEVQNHDLIYHVKDSTVTTRGTMKELERSLENEGFFRCNKCYLVNLEHVEGCEENDVLVHGEKVQVSRARKKELLDVLNDYMNEVSK